MTFALVLLNERLINRDYWYFANRRDINNFKTGIVDRVQSRLNHKKKPLGLFLFSADLRRYSALKSAPIREICGKQNLLPSLPHQLPTNHIRRFHQFLPTPIHSFTLLLYQAAVDQDEVTESGILQSAFSKARK